MSDNANETVEPQEEAGAVEESEKTYTKDDIERIVKNRLAKFDDYDSIKNERDELLRAKEESASSTQAVETAFEEFKVSATKRIVDAETKALAASMNFLYPDDVHLYIDADKAVDENGNVSAELISEQLTTLAEERPALVRTNSKTTGTDVGLGTTGTPRKKSTGQLFADALGQQL